MNFCFTDRSGTLRCAYPRRMCPFQAGESERARSLTRVRRRTTTCVTYGTPIRVQSPAARLPPWEGFIAGGYFCRVGMAAIARLVSAGNVFREYVRAVKRKQMHGLLASHAKGFSWLRVKFLVAGGESHNLGKPFLHGLLEIGKEIQIRGCVNSRKWFAVRIHRFM